jgi:hypothetical protein
MPLNHMILTIFWLLLFQTTQGMKKLTVKQTVCQGCLEECWGVKLT